MRGGPVPRNSRREDARPWPGLRELAQARRSLLERARASQVNIDVELFFIARKESVLITLTRPSEIAVLAT